MDGIPNQDLFMSVAIFFLFSFIVIYPPQEARQLGFVIPQVFGFLMKDEKFDFIRHHIQRTCVTVIVHASLPLMYTLAMYFTYFETLRIHNSFGFIKIMIRISFTILFIAIGYLYTIWKNNYSGHPILRNLTNYVNAENNLESLISQINVEIRSFENFKVEYAGYSKVLVTENWIIKVSTYSVTFIKKSDARAKLIRALDSILPTESAEVQFLYVLVESVSGVAKPISIKVSGRQQFNELKDKLGGNVEIVYGIEFKVSLNDQCTNCISRIFASKQDPSKTDQWLGGRADCPTCRASFCALDVCLLSGAEIDDSR
ncbi:hypothetical protein FO519_009138 [Halicephalobus sp. NKZ332]|nr:hypothetical protein FO519_009138 [Halicephalobus sp. NKZ332]